MPVIVESFRHWVQWLPVTFVVAGTRALKQAIVGEQQRLFQLGPVVELKELDKPAARELVTEPVLGQYTVTTRAREVLIDETQNHPFLLQNACNKLFARMKTRQASMATFRDAMAALDEMSLDDGVFSHLLGDIVDDERRAVLRALAEVTSLDEDRGTVEGIVEQLASHGALEYANPAFVQSQLDALDDLLDKGRGRERYRLKPPVLAKSVRNKREFAL